MCGGGGSEGTGLVFDDIVYAVFVNRISESSEWHADELSAI
jgi:hypothetical protein